MDIKEALVQIKRVPSVLEAFKTVDELLTLADSSRESIDDLTQEKADLENSISQRKIDFEEFKKQCVDQTIQLSEHLEKAKADSKEKLKNMIESVNKSYDEAVGISNAKISELNEKATALKVEIKNLNREIAEKQELMNDLNKSIDAIRSRLR